MPSTPLPPADDQDEEGLDSWFRDEDYSMEDWAYAVLNDDTHQGYIDWVVSQREMNEDPISAKLEAQIVSPQESGLDANGRAPVPERLRTDEMVERWRREVENIDTRIGFECWLLREAESDPEYMAFVEAQEQGADLDENTPASAQVAPRKIPRP